MAKIATSSEEKIFKINKWLGVNECPDGDTNLKTGEAAVMRNFRITDDGSLQIRPGTKNVVGVSSGYSVSVADAATTVKSGLNVPPETFTAYPDINVSSAGILSLSGTPVTVTKDNITSYTGYYWTDTTGIIYKLGTLTITRPTSGTLVTGGSVEISSGNPEFICYYAESTFTYTDVSVSNSSVVLSGTGAILGRGGAYPDSASFLIGRYTRGHYTGSPVFLIASWTLMDGGDLRASGHEVLHVADDTYKWEFYKVSAGPSGETDNEVRGMWSGYVGGTEYIVAACNGHLWSLSETDGVWAKTDLGFVTTSNGNVHMFGFDDKLYVMSGTEYKVWDGSTFDSVTGYRPLVLVAVIPAGSGTELEGINKLNGLRRAWYSPDGAATLYQLPETGLYSVDYVKDIATDTDYGTGDYTVDLTAGTVTFDTAPSTGVNTIEIGWTSNINYRPSVVAMRFSELFNGPTDTRVFIYGDGTNKVFYSDIDYDGVPRADYFPDLNEAEIGDSNTPVTGMIRHYGRLLAFKENSAYSIAYDTITLASGATAAGFYVYPVNRYIGNAAPGHVQLVENYARTIDGNSIYEWKATSSYGNVTNDQRNAKRISQRIESTLKSMDLAEAATYFDKINHEYYIFQGGTAIVHNTENDTWYIYTNFPAVCMINYGNDVYFGSPDGYIRRFSRDYRNDNGEAIDAHWESGSMDFNADFRRKQSSMMWISLKPEPNSEIHITVKTDNQTVYSEFTRSSGYLDFNYISFSHFSFNTSKMPQAERTKIKAKKFTRYKLIMSSDSNVTTATVTNADIRVRYAGYAR